MQKMLMMMNKPSQVLCMSGKCHNQKKMVVFSVKLQSVVTSQEPNGGTDIRL